MHAVLSVYEEGNIFRFVLFFYLLLSFSPLLVCTQRRKNTKNVHNHAEGGLFISCLKLEYQYQKFDGWYTSTS